MTKKPDWRASIKACIAFSSRDWSLNHRDAWIYGVIMGWSPEALAEQKQIHNWSDSTVTRLKTLHEQYLKETMTDHPISSPPLPRTPQATGGFQ